MNDQTEELQNLAETLAQWIDPVPGISTIYLFGSRVRGDHRFDSDVDVRLFVEKMKPDEATSRWWEEQNETFFAEINGRLPGPLGLHRDTPDAADTNILSGRQVLVVRKVICVWTPPKPFKAQEI
jgi:predicted nucleotidyltransferase